MRRIKNISWVLVAMILLAGCIKSYDPKIDSNMENKFVVSGRVTDTEGWQEVEVSLSSPIESPAYIPVGGCQVTIVDNMNNVFPLEEFQPGLYRVWMAKKYLSPGRSFQVSVRTPDGDWLASGFDTMPRGPQVDSVYYQVKDVPTPNPDINLSVMQFYVNLDAVGDYSQYYKWEVVETWEYHAAYPKEFYYDGTFHEYDPPDYSMKVCWITSLVKNVFTVSTKNLSQNIYNKYPLQTVNGYTSRLGIMYSPLVRQLALSEAAYNYWEQLRFISNEQGGLYEKQPFAIQGNIENLTHPEKDVLGYFYAASESTRRYFYKDVEGIELDFSNYCVEGSLGMFGWKEYSPYEYPIYYNFNAGALVILNHYCVDCTLQGGTTEKPDFWPN